MVLRASRTHPARTAAERRPAPASTAIPCRAYPTVKIQGLPPLIWQSLGIFVTHKLLSLKYSYPPISLLHKKTGSGSLSRKPLSVPEVPGRRLFSHLEIPGFPHWSLPPEWPGTEGGRYKSTARRFSSFPGKGPDTESGDCRPG